MGWREVLKHVYWRQMRAGRKFMGGFTGGRAEGLLGDSWLGLQKGKSYGRKIGY